MHLNKPPPPSMLQAAQLALAPPLSPSSWPDGTVPVSAPDSQGQDRNWGPEWELGADLGGWMSLNPGCLQQRVVTRALPGCPCTWL